MQPKAIPVKRLLLGPTACGKTRWALDYLADQDVDIISIDSCQVYRELSIGSAKISPQDALHLPHYVIDVVALQDTYDVGCYLRDVQNAEQQVLKNKRRALYLGGSMLYAHTLMHGLNDVPLVPKALWQDIEAQCSEHGVAYVWEQLVGLDPSYHTRLHPNDRQRIVRALAVLLHTQAPLYSYWQPRPQQRAHLAMIMPASRNALFPQVEQRSQDMLDHGIMEEVRAFYDGSISPSYQGMRSIGYRETWAYVHGDIASVEVLKERIIHATMHYIKQQITWMKRWTAQADIIVEQGDASLLQWWQGSQAST